MSFTEDTSDGRLAGRIVDAECNPAFNEKTDSVVMCTIEIGLKRKEVEGTAASRRIALTHSGDSRG